MGLNVVGVPASARLAGPASQVVAHAPWAFRTKAEQVSDVTLQQPKQGPGQKALAPRVTTSTLRSKRQPPWGQPHDQHPIPAQTARDHTPR